MYIVGIAGGSGSGKTTFAQKIISLLGNAPVQILHMDSYYLDPQPENNLIAGKANFDHPQAFDWELLRSHLFALKQGQPIETPVYDFATSARTGETKTITAEPVLIFEGIFALIDDEIRKMLDIKSFLHVDSDIRFTRRLHRDVQERGRSLDSVIDQYYATVRPMYIKYLDPQKHYADFTVGEETDIAARILAAKIEKLIESSNGTKSTPEEGSFLNL